MAERERGKERTICSVGRRGKGAKKEKISGHAHSTCQRVVARAISTPSAAVDVPSPTHPPSRDSAAAPRRPLFRRSPSLALPPGSTAAVAAATATATATAIATATDSSLPQLSSSKPALPSLPDYPTYPLDLPSFRGAASPPAGIPSRAPLTRATVPRPGRAGVNRSRTSIGRTSQRSLLFLLSHNACLSERVPRASCCRSGLSRASRAFSSPLPLSVVSLSPPPPSLFVSFPVSSIILCNNFGARCSERLVSQPATNNQ